MTCHSPRDLTFPWQPCFDRYAFSNFNFPYFKKIKTSFLVAIFKSLDRFIVFLFVLITFEPILDGFGGFGQIQKSKMADQDDRHSELITQLLRHVTS